ncbi:MAG: MotA/TolQ/ExbB proton channel family protein [Lentisphaeria bacterium]|nr:MotA/TolQ/ExbB proton channel family protein [Lentisphaeria bacterium]
MRVPEEFLRTVAASLAAGGWLMLPLLLTAFLIWASYLWLLLRFRGCLRGAEAHDLDLERRLTGAEGAEQTWAWLATLPGAVPRMTRHVLLRVRAGMSLRDACGQCRFFEMDEFCYAMVWLAALVVAAPLMGLLGTVLGMVETFDAVALRGGDAADLVAAGISRALVTTQTGLLAALPGTFGLAHLYRLYRRLGNRLDCCASHLALVFEHGPASVTPAATGMG